MKKSKHSMLKGFTLIELMVVVTIIAVLAALIVPALQRAQAKAMAMKCLSVARSIGATIRTYASVNDGWTNPDRAHYVKDFGYRLSGETGYEGDAPYTWASDSTKASYQTALRIRDFCCPVDAAPESTVHAVPSSYAVTSAFAGGNIMNLIGEANRILMIKETGEKNHPRGNAGLDRNYVFADLSTTLGYNGPALPGLRMRAYRQNNSSGIRNVAESQLPAAPYETEHVGAFSYGVNWALVLDNAWTHTSNGGNLGYWNWGGGWTRYLDSAVCVRADGLLRFPAPGNWQYRARSSTYTYERSMGLGTPDGNPMALQDVTSFTWSSNGAWGPNGPWTTVNVTDAGLYYPLQFVTVGNSNWNGCFGYFNMQWQGDEDRDGTYEIGATNIPGSALFMLP